jgi:ammonium transporter, Amt family
VNTPSPVLSRRRPKFTLARRLKAAACAVLLALLLVPLLTWAQPAPTSASNHTPATAAKPDPTGLSYGLTAAPAPTDNASPTAPADLYPHILHTRYSINFVWTLFAGFLVMFMQLGFAMLETGLCRARNAGHTFAMCLMIFPLGCVSFLAYGFALGCGNWIHAPHAPDWQSTLGPGMTVLNAGWGLGPHPDGSFTYGLLGLKGWFLSASVADPGVLALFFFMMVFMDVAAIIPTGAMAERWTWNNFCLYGLWAAFPFALFANWVWGGGWLAQMGQNWHLGNGACDFAGSGVVHCMGGIIALMGAMIIGPRIGKFINGKPRAIPGHNLPMVIAGTLILAFGWFGFNPGSTLAGTDLRISFIVVNTILAGATGALASMLVMQFKFGKPDPSVMCNGMLAGFVAITAPSAFVSPIGAALIGFIAGVLVVYSVFFWDKMGIDDPVGAISVHGVVGFFGVLAVGLFASGDYGAGYNGVASTVKGIMPFGSVAGVAFFTPEGFRQLAAQSIEACACVCAGALISYALFKLSNRIAPMRVSREIELQGLDIPEMGALGYPDFELKTTMSAHEMSTPMRLRM